MPRQARVILPGTPHHIVQRGTNRINCFRSDQDYQYYLSWLEEYADRTDCRIHAFVIMPNHVHMLVTPDNLWGCGEMMRRLGQRYSQFVNQKYGRSGALWEGRYRSCIACEPDYILRCYRYIEQNPVRANLVADPADYPWTSYRINALGEESHVIEQDDAYYALGDNDQERQQAYLKRFNESLQAPEIEQIRRLTNANMALGSPSLYAQLEQRVGRRMQLRRSNLSSA